MQLKTRACQIRITGIVQGVGFRPHVYRLARLCGIKGWVLNSSTGVMIEAEGPWETLQEFARRLVEEAPPLAVIRSCAIKEIEFQGFTDFIIRPSEKEDEQAVMISPDIAICSDCQREVRDPTDRRYTYPFTNCTNCGPRFTIIKDIPYDRAMTTMASFPMCADCQEEYNNPLHRRFHAQPNACPNCGPHTTLLDSEGRLLKASPTELLKRGLILAIKGLGGFHLAADASNSEAVQTLRQRKRRDAKPFAVMVRDLEVAKRYCHITPTEARWLTSPQAPIVVLPRINLELLPGELIHPGLNTLGVMLPYTPLHYLLFDEELEVLIMTSANISDEPLIIDNREAVDKLAGVADAFLLHNREIYNPCDDSVVQITSLGTPLIMRRARGFVPRGIRIPVMSRPVLALGGEMKNTFCITREGEAFLSQHWGDLNHYLNYCRFVEGIERFKKIVAVEPQLIAHDLHPEYQTTRWARTQEALPRVPIQHHYAHMGAVMAENGLEGEVLGLICDGTGWGTDGAVWGGEILKGDYQQFSRRGHLRYLPLPGGDLTARRPYRMALMYLLAAAGEEALALADRYLPGLPTPEKDLIVRYWKQGMKKEMLTSSCGRLFDAVSAFLGICPINQYEGQAAVELEVCADHYYRGSYPYRIEKTEGMWVMDILPAWQQMINDRERGQSTGLIAKKFHLTLINMFTETLLKLKEETGLNRVVLSGGVFHNQIILVELKERLEVAGFTVYQHQQVPPGDGGLSLGQAVIASYTSQ